VQNLSHRREFPGIGLANNLDVYCVQMPKTAHREEIEIKLRVQDVAALRSRLKRLRAREITPRTYESNTLYDTPRHDLRRRVQIIRIRIEQPPSSFGKKRPDENAAALLTYKGPASMRNAIQPASHSKTRGLFKIKEEAEVSFAGAGELARILGALGFHPVFRYEKFRTTYSLPNIRGLRIELDETPVGIYLELEGPVAGIDRAARLLGYTRKDYMTDSYGSLYLAACRRRGQTPGDMLFPPTKKLR
jgi:adenylate cyclase class 2